MPPNNDDSRFRAATFARSIGALSSNNMTGR
jgi:hypothetical protein